MTPEAIFTAITVVMGVASVVFFGARICVYLKEEARNIHPVTREYPDGMTVEDLKSLAYDLSDRTARIKLSGKAKSTTPGIRVRETLGGDVVMESL